VNKYNNSFFAVYHYPRVDDEQLTPGGSTKGLLYEYPTRKLKKGKK